MNKSHVRLSSTELDEKGMRALAEHLGGAEGECAKPLLDHVGRVGARFLVVEEPYIDRDYSADYVHFYSSAFKSYPRHTKRLHLFRHDPSATLSGDMAQQASATAVELGYLGFVVVRPIRQGPVGRTVLAFPDLGPGLLFRPAARSSVEVGLRATRLKIRGAPFIQQDRRIGACAQAAIWMASRPVHERHGTSSWHSVAQITALATTPTDADLSKALPHGSDGLNPIHITRALRGMGHQPLSDQFQREGERDKAKPPPTKAFEALLPYLDSGLPVILGIPPASDEQLGHAVTAIGYAETTGPALREGHGYDRFVRALVVHDDQHGPYRLMPLTSADAAALPPELLLKDMDGKTPTVEAAVSHLFVPLSSRILLRADHADIIARDFLHTRVADMRQSLIADMEKEAPGAAEPMLRFCDDHDAGCLALRTYITTAGKYRHHLAGTDAPEEVKLSAVTRTLPHFIYVTELIREDAVANEAGVRPVLGHLVFNATSSTDPDSNLLFAHLPHLAFERDLDCDPARGEFAEDVIGIETHREYAQRVRS